MTDNSIIIELNGSDDEVDEAYNRVRKAVEKARGSLKGSIVTADGVVVHLE